MNGALGWLLTFALHGTLMLSGVWVVSRLLRESREGIAELLWKLAPPAAILTASLQVAFVSEPAGGHLLQLPRVDEPAALATGAAGDVVAPQEIAVTPLVEDASPAAEADAQPIVAWLLPAMLGLTLLTLAGHAWRLTALRRLLAARAPVTDGDWIAARDRLARAVRVGRRVRLSASSGLDGPVAFGVLRPEICVPTRAVDHLGAEARDAVLAHELAHLRRADPLWLACFGWLVALFPWQPLLRVAREQYRRIAEFRCDADAARQTTGPQVARTLLEVADWLAGSKIVRSGLSWGMAAGGSLLGRRVERLLQAGPSGRAGRWLGLPLGSLLLALTFVLPGVGAGDEAVRDATPVAARSRDPRVEQLDLQVRLLLAEARELRALMERLPRDEAMERIWNTLQERMDAFERRRRALERGLDGRSPAPPGGGARTNQGEDR